ncbi:MAG: HDOD domain-containing protein [Steroidobacteraceae bacterium]|jgi:HD-like signal output (HDOD) protein|nr:HDOD domain-containing protein [Steroidobacteraceae bacterium]
MRLSVLVLLTLVVLGAILYGIWRRRGDARRDAALDDEPSPPQIPARQVPPPTAVRTDPPGSQALLPPAARPGGRQGPGAFPGTVSGEPPEPGFADTLVLSASVEAARTAAAGRAASQRALHELALGIAPIGPFPQREHAHVVNAVLATLEDAASQSRYLPRRPSVVPQLLKTMNDPQASRREISGIISRDPALATDLLQLANSAWYRTSPAPIESIDRAVAVLGHDGIRSLLSAAIVQPMFRMPPGPFQRFPQVAWDHSAAASIASESLAALAENDDPFAAQLLALLVGVGGIIVFRVTLDTYASDGTLRPSPEAIAMLIDRQAAAVARRIATRWELSERMIGALNDQSAADSTSVVLLSPLGRALLLGRELGALSVLAREGVLPAAEARARALACGAPPRLVERIWVRLAQPA